MLGGSKFLHDFILNQQKITAADAHNANVKKDKKGRVKSRHGTKTGCLLYTSPSPRDRQQSRMPSSA